MGAAAIGRGRHLAAAPGNGARRRCKVVLGPGTGLGVAALVPADGRWRWWRARAAVASFGPQAADEAEVFARLREQPRCRRRDRAVGSGPAAARGRSIRGRSTASRRPSWRAPWRASHPRWRRRGCSCGCWDASPATWRSPSRRWAGSTSPAVSPAAGAVARRAAVPQCLRGAPALRGAAGAIPILLITCKEPGLIGCAALSDEQYRSRACNLRQSQLGERLAVALGRIRRERQNTARLMPRAALATSAATVPTAIRAARSGGKR